MMELFFILIFALTVFFSAIMAFDKEEIAWPILAFVGWIVLAVFSIGSVEKTFTTYIAAENRFVTYTLEYGGGPFLTLFFAGIAIIFVIILWNRVSEIYRRA